MRRLLAATLFLAISPLAFSQQVTGSILGSVQDAQGAMIAGAQVTAKNQDTGFSRTIASNGQGEYRIDFLPPGTYQVQVMSKGFRNFSASGIALAVGQFARVDAH